VEQYLDYCLQSVLRQTYTNLEIILVDDGSSDASGGMCDAYSVKDSRIKVIHKSNGGLSSARNSGMVCMTGEYFTFIDSDDYIRADCIEKMYFNISNDNSDMLICSFKKVADNQDCSFKTYAAKEHFQYEREQVKLKMLSGQLPMYAHGRLYRAYLAKYINFPDGRLYEDIPTNWNVIKYVDRVTYITDELYFYRQRQESIVNSEYSHNKMDQLYFAEKILSEISPKEELYYAAMSKCFFAAADTYSLVTKSFPEDYAYLCSAIKAYRADVLKNRLASKKLKLMAAVSYISVGLVRITGKLFKKYNHLKWKLQ
jgi:glycosyltransferase involved in cell wall biosynthesis